MPPRGTVEFNSAEVDVPVAAIFDTLTVAGLAERLRGTPADLAPAGPMPVLAPAQDTSPAPLSFGQQRLWFLHRLEPKSVAYNIPVAVQMSGELDRAGWQNCPCSWLHVPFCRPLEYC